MAASPQHVTLTAATVATVTFDVDFNHIEVTNVDGAAAVYFRVGSTAPTVEGTGSHVVPAVAGRSVVLDVHTANATVVKLISAGTPKVSVQGW